MKVNIKKVNPQRVLRTIFELDEKIFTKEYHLRSTTVQELSDYLQGAIFYMAYEAEKPIGYISYRFKNKDAEIIGLAVLPEYQNRGIGKLLMNKISAALGKQTFFLVTHPHNSQAIRFYLNCGFKIIEWRDNYYENNQPRLILRRDQQEVNEGE